ncbi:GNAT family N-acetyltransferase [Streptomyces sp. NPDC001795]|uniref:GNAT family N-acetyltransferase n=1 Tax=unclassified Streptomyces TaxID=2593676 RepID=UPI003333F95E
MVREHGQVVAAAGYRAWPRRTAHIGVLTAPEGRGRGLARVTGSAAVAHAFAAGLLPQWRAPSRLPTCCSRIEMFSSGFSVHGAGVGPR